jgi:predicted MFS family arabinose efflux permease
MPFETIAVLTAVALLLYAGYGVLWTFFNVYLDAGLHVPTSIIGVLMAVGTLLSGMLALAAPLAMARWGTGVAIVIGFIGMTVALLALALVPHWIAAGVGYVGYLSTMALVEPTLALFGQEAVNRGWRPTMSAALAMAQGASMGAFALGGGYAITALGYQSPYWIAAGLTAAGAVVFWAAFVRGSRQAGRPVDGMTQSV